MKTTLVIDDGVMRRLRQRAAREGRTISELVEAALRLLLDSKRPPAQLPPLPLFQAGQARVDIANRDALHDLMDER